MKRSLHEYGDQKAIVKGRFPFFRHTFTLSHCLLIDVNYFSRIFPDFVLEGGNSDGSGLLTVAFWDVNRRTALDAKVEWRLRSYTYLTMPLFTHQVRHPTPPMPVTHNADGRNTGALQSTAAGFPKELDRQT